MYVTLIKIFLSRSFLHTKPKKCVIQRYFDYINISIEVQILRKKCRVVSAMFHSSCIYSKYKKGWYCFKIFGIIALPLHTFHKVLYTITTATNTLSLSVLYGLVQRPSLLILQLSIPIHIYFCFLFRVRYKMMTTSRRASLIQWLHTYPMNHMLRCEIVSNKRILSIVLEASIH